MLMRLICKYAGHKVNRQRVWDDGYAFRTNCTRCDTPLIRDLNSWRPFDPAIDANPARRQHPRSNKP
jgi:hypothetical protein